MIKYLKNIKYNNLYKNDSSSKIIYYNTYKEKHNAEVIFKQLNTVDAAIKYKDKNILILNFASPRFPGGGYKLGFNTQEESLCYASSLYKELSKKYNKKFYLSNINPFNPLFKDSAILSENITFFRDSNFNFIKPFKANILTIAAPNNSDVQFMPWIKKEDVKKALSRKIDIINYVINTYNFDTIILGAFGCGAFGNDPYVVAKLFKEKISFSGTCVFAIPKENTLEKFKNVFVNN